MGSLVYFIFALINFLTFPPIACTEDSDNVISIREANRHDTAFDQAKTVIPPLARTVGEILGDDAAGVDKSELRYRERDAMFFLVLPILLWVPLEPSLGHNGSLA